MDIPQPHIHQGLQLLAHLRHVGQNWQRVFDGPVSYTHLDVYKRQAMTPNSLLLLANVLGANLTGCEKAEKRNAVRSTFDGGPSVGLLALHQAHHGGDHHPGFPGSLDGVDGGGAGGAHVVHDHHPGALAAEALDAAAGAVSLLGLANEEACLLYTSRCV